MFSDTSISPHPRYNLPRESVTAVSAVAVVGSAVSNTPAFRPAVHPESFQNNSHRNSNYLDSPAQPNKSEKTQQLLVSIEDIQCFSQTMKAISAKQIPILDEFPGDPQKLVNILTAQIFTLVDQVHSLSDKLEESIIGQQCLSEKFLHLRSNYYRMLTRSTSTATSNSNSSSKSQQYFSQGSLQQNVLSNSNTDNNMCMYGTAQSHDENAQPEGISHNHQSMTSAVSVSPQLRQQQASPLADYRTGIDPNGEKRNHNCEGAKQHEKTTAQDIPSSLQGHQKYKEHNDSDKPLQHVQSQQIDSSFPRESMSMEARLEDIRKDQALVQQTLKNSNLRDNQQQQQHQSVQSSSSIHKGVTPKQDKLFDSRCKQQPSCVSAVSIENNPSQKLFGTQQIDLPFQFSGLMIPK